MRVNSRTRTLVLKVVYYGPGMSGKTTNLRRIHDRLPEGAKGELIQLSTETERTLFFDYCPIELGRLGDFRLRVHIFTVPGQSFYRQTRGAVLNGASKVAGPPRWAIRPPGTMTRSASTNTSSRRWLI